MALLCLRALQDITETLRATDGTLSHSVEYSKSAVENIEYRRECDLIPEEEVRALTAKRSKVLQEKYKAIAGKLKMDLQDKQGQEHNLKLELEKIQQQIKSEVKKQIALTEPERKDKLEHMKRRRKFLASAVEKLKDEKKPPEDVPSKLVPGDIVSAKSVTSQLQQKLKIIQEQYQREQQEVSKLEIKEKRKASEKEMETESAGGTDGEVEDARAEEAANDESRQRKEKLMEELKFMRETLDDLKLQKQDFENSKSKKEGELQKKQKDIQELEKKIPTPVPMPQNNQNSSIDVKALSGFSRVLFPAQLSGAISEILVMVSESKIKVDGSRIVAKKDVVVKLDSTWAGESDAEKLRLSQKAIDEMVSRKLVAQDGEHIWEVRA